MNLRHEFGLRVILTTPCVLVACAVVAAIAIADDAATKSPDKNGASEKPSPKADEVAQKPSWYQLVNVTIPADSSLRNDPDVHRPPELYVVVRRDGVEIDIKCTRQKGWSVDFEKSDDGGVNVWPIKQGTPARFTVEVWDNHVWKNHMIFNVTGLSAKDFDSTIHEQGGKLVEKDRLATITFQRTAAVPAKYKPAEK